MIVNLIDNQGHDFSSVYPIVQDRFPDLAKHSIRARYYRNSETYKAKRLNKPLITGVGPAEAPDENEVLRRAIEEYRSLLRTKNRKQQQVIAFDAGPVCLAFLADVHAGGSGVNYERLIEEAEIIRDTPGMYAVTVGDLVDQFVIGSLRNLRFTSKMSIEEEWIIARHLLGILAPKILASVSGNHDNWSSYLVGIDYFRDVLASIRPSVLYDEHDCRFRLVVGDSSWRIRVRHKWDGVSQWNITYGIERAARFDGDFDIGVGAHTHASGVTRMFNNGGCTGFAVLCGSYKEFDEYAEKEGFPKSNSGTAMPILFNESGTCVPFENVSDAAEYMEILNG